MENNLIQQLAAVLPNEVMVDAIQSNLTGGQRSALDGDETTGLKPSYFDLTITDSSGQLNGVFDSFCIDTDRFLGFEGYDFNNDGDTVDTDINNPVLGSIRELDPIRFSAKVYSSYGDLPDGLVENSGNLDLINWIINQDYVGQSSSSNGVYTVGDVQQAIWQLADNDAGITDGDPLLDALFDGYDDARVQEIIAAAQQPVELGGGEGFVPGFGQKVAVILVPDGNGGAPDGQPDGQVIFAAVEVNKLVEPASLGDKVFLDNNGNGIQDNGELGVAGVTVTLTGDGADGVIGTNDDTTATTTTNAEGIYRFNNLTPGEEYKVTFSDIPDGFAFTPANAGSDDAVDSDADPANGMTQTVVLEAGEFNETLDAGLVQLASLGDYVFEDLDADGVQDAEEKGIKGATVKLLQDGNVIATAKTGEDGKYYFEDLYPGDYQVEFITPDGFSMASLANVGSDDAVDSDGPRSAVVTLAPGESNLTLDAGFFNKAGLGDFVFNDTDGDGVQDANEYGVANVAVELLDGAGKVIASTTTDGAGKYYFNELMPGDYQVQFTAPDGFAFTTADAGNDDALDSDADLVTGKTQTVTLTSGEFNGTLDAGLVQMASLGDYVFEDLDADGVQDAGEKGIGGATVKLLQDGNVIATAKTGEDGKYYFEDLYPGDYQVEFITPDGFSMASLANVGSDDAVDSDGPRSAVVTLAPGESNLTLDAGFFNKAGLGDFVFNDTDGDGVQDANENGVANVTVDLLDGAGKVIASTTTDGAGKYYFNELMPGDYQVQFTAPDGFAFTTADAGNDDALDSDADLVTGKTQTVTLTSGEFNGTLDAGLVELNPGIDIEKYVNGIDVQDLNNLPEIVAGENVTFTYEVTNTGNVAFTKNEVVVTDDHGTPGNYGDDFTATLVESSDVGDDGVLSAGETWLYTSATYAAQNLTTASDPQDLTVSFTGSSSLDGANGNVRTFTQGDVSVDVSAFRRQSGGTWDTAYLGAYSGGLGVTNRGESASYHRVDNGGSVEYLLFEFDQDVTLNKAFLNYVGQDSDISVWIGDRNGSDLSALSDNLLNSFVKENNFTSSGYSRWADVNNGGLAGDTVVISAYTGHTNDSFKLKKLDVSVAGEAVAGVYQNTATVTAQTVSDSDTSGYVNATPNPGIDIEKFVNGIDVTDINNLPEIAAGADVTFTYEVTNTGNVSFAAHEVVVSDDHGTPHNTGDDFTPTLVASSDVGSDGILSAGETWHYTSDTYVAQNLTTTSNPQDLRFSFTGSSYLDGANGNVRSFTQGDVSVDVSAFRRKSGGTWDTAYLGAYSGGLGVTNRGESTSYHRVDNGGSVEYLLFEFDQDVTLNKAFLNYVGQDSDISVWIGDRNGSDLPALSDNLLNSFTKENNFTSSSYSRWADVNNSGLAGDTVVISAYTGHTNDSFKLKKLDVSVASEAVAGVYQNTATVTAQTVSDSDISGYVNSQSQSEICAKLVGSSGIHEGNQGSYYVELDAVSTVDRYFTLQVDNGSAERVDHYAGNQDIIWGGYYDTRNSWGNVTKVTYDRVPNGTDPRLGDRAATGPSDASWDYTLYKNGTIDAGNTVTVKVAAGQTQSEAFQVQTWLENVTVDRDSPNNSGYYEGTEQFSISLVSGDADQFCIDHLDVSIYDQTDYDFVSPIVLDLNGDGIQTTALGATTGSFDLLANGSPIESGWLSGEDAFLAVDRNNNGVIDGNDELFGGGVGDGFAKLASFDANGDSLINSDEILSGGLMLWQDGNENHRTDAGELLTLASQGIESLSTTFKEIPVYQHGNLLLEHGVANRTDGSQIDMVDAYFQIEPAVANPLPTTPETLLT